MKKKETAIIKIRIKPSVHKKLRKLAFVNRLTIGDVVERMLLNN